MATSDAAQFPAARRSVGEMDAVIAYLQVLGTMIKFQEGVNYRDDDTVGD